MRNLRLYFSKTGRAKYVSHLDLNRSMLRAFRRSGVPIWYTEGFNPHPYISFALALPLGAESLREVMDVRIEGDMENEEIVSRLNAVMPEGLEVLSAVEPWSKVGEITAASYEFYFEDENFDESLLRDILSSGEIMVEKMGKKKGHKVMKEVNLAEHILDFSFANEGIYNVLYIKLSAGSEKNANPILLADAIANKSGGKLSVDRLVRTALLTADGREFS